MRARKIRRLLILAVCCVCASISALASVYSGQVNFGGLPVPGATLTATQGDKSFSVTTEEVVHGTNPFPGVTNQFQPVMMGESSYGSWRTSA